LFPHSTSDGCANFVTEFGADGSSNVIVTGSEPVVVAVVITEFTSKVAAKIRSDHAEDSEGSRVTSSKKRSSWCT
jgi:hypothetical protein